jgi:hypothetical protein
MANAKTKVSMKKSTVNIYTFGYWGYGGDARGLNRRLQTFNQNTRGRGLFWVDLRIRRSVRAKDFIGDAPRRIFGAANYEWIQEFGNLDILDGKGVRIKNYGFGFEKLLGVLAKARSNNLDVIMFCACEHLSDCHRNNVMRWVKNRIKAWKIPEVRVVGEFPTTLFTNYYDRPEDEASFNRWRKDHPQGFFLNCEPNWRFKLHRSNCHHFGSTSRTIGEDGWSITRIPKKCDLDQSKLKKWARTWAAKLDTCTSCLTQ